MARLENKDLIEHYLYEPNDQADCASAMPGPGCLYAACTTPGTPSGNHQSRHSVPPGQRSQPQAGDTVTPIQNNQGNIQQTSSVRSRFQIHSIESLVTNLYHPYSSISSLGNHCTIFCFSVFLGSLLICSSPSDP